MTTKPMQFETEEATKRWIFANHLEQFGAFPHMTNRIGCRGWTIIFRHPGAGCMAQVLENGEARLLEDW